MIGLVLFIKLTNSIAAERHGNIKLQSNWIFQMLRLFMTRRFVRDTDARKAWALGRVMAVIIPGI